MKTEFVWKGHPANAAQHFKLPPEGTNPRVDPFYKAANEPQLKVALKPV